MKGQASAEHLMLLGAVLIVGLVVIGLFMFYPGTSEEKLSTASMAYWAGAQPIAIREALGGSFHYQVAGTAGHQGVFLVLKNTGKEKIIIKAIDIEDSDATNPLYAGDDIHPELQIQLPAIAVLYDSDPACNQLDHADHNCNIPLNPGEEMKFVTIPYLFDFTCSSEEESINSLKKSISVPVSIYYERGGITQLQKGAVDLVTQCNDYFQCGVTGDCESHYGISCGVLCICDGRCVDNLNCNNPLSCQPP